MIFIAFFIAALAVALAVPYAVRMAQAANYVDMPDARKIHEGAVPPVGGMVIFLVFFLMQLFAPSSLDVTAPWILLGLIILVFTGFIDDRWRVPAVVKFGLHFLVAFLAVVPGDVELQTLGNLFGLGEFSLGWFAIPFTVACIVYLINALNMMDGMDGLAGGLSLIICFWLLYASIQGGQGAPYPLVLLAGCLCGFLWHNARHPKNARAKLFLGDAGAMGLAYILSVYAIRMGSGDAPLFTPIAAAWILALPIVDAFGLLVARLRAGKHPFEPDNNHFHHRFLAVGFAPEQATPLILLLAFLMGAFGVLGSVAGIPLPVLSILWIVLWLGHAYLVARPEPLLACLRLLRKVTAKK
ncbi:MAG: undecaprenyl/decaprenyl-phosphate alpha-N-acetylglucosaminyl 1-phosphate transferase [Alphaproteobacteria bacterium]|nr:undecaprenyl/decaprenyl-phosphate alpha-N-acetylglucosaminyl 1-phosphate transferase [Alphaproteobacteria bacterium]